MNVTAAPKMTRCTSNDEVIGFIARSQCSAQSLLARAEYWLFEFFEFPAERHNDDLPCR
jgi:hypothetical protein